MLRKVALRLASRSMAACAVRRAASSINANARVGVAIRTASHSGLSNAVYHELQEEQSRSDKREQPQPPAGWNVTHVPSSAKFRLTRTFEDEQLEIRCALPEAKTSTNPEESDTGSMSNVTLLVNKGTETIRFGLSIENQELVLDTVSHFKDSAIPKDETPAGEAKCRSMYAGPVISELDSALVEEFLSYLEARGVNDDIAVFITEFAFWKEQNEYEAWLSSIANFTR